MDSQTHQTRGRLPHEELPRLACRIERLTIDDQRRVEDASAEVGILPHHRQQSSSLAGSVEECTGRRRQCVAPQVIDVGVDAERLARGLALSAGRGRVGGSARLSQRGDEAIAVVCFGGGLHATKRLRNVLIGDLRRGRGKGGGR